jgi:hypothetical protein
MTAFSLDANGEVVGGRSEPRPYVRSWRGGVVFSLIQVLGAAYVFVALLVETQGAVDFFCNAYALGGYDFGGLADGCG